MLLASLLLACSKPHAAPLQMEMRATRLTEIVKQLGTTLDRRLYVSPELNDRVLIVRFDGVDPDLALTKIAQATDAQWIQRGENTVLTITSARQNALTAQWYEARTKGIQKAIEKIAAPLRESPKFDMKEAKKLEEQLSIFDAQAENQEETGGMGFYKNMQSLFARGPAGRAIAELLRQCDPGQIARLPLNSRSVFATRPNRLQLPMPRGIDAVLTNLRTDSLTWKQALESAPSRPKKDRWYGGDPRRVDVPETPVAKVLLFVETYGAISTINLKLVAYDEKGEPLFTNQSQIDPGFSAGYQDSEPLLAAMGKDPNHVLSEESRKWIAFQDLSYVSPERPDAAWLKTIADPVSRDPLSFVPSELILAYAKYEKKNLVANVTDDLMTSANDLLKSPKLNLVGYINYIKGRSHYGVESEGNWIQIKPDGTIGPPQYPQDRFALKHLLDSALATGYLSLDAMSEYAKSVGDDWSGAAFYSLRVLLPRSERLLQFTNMAALRFFGQLSPAQRRSLREGEEIQLGAITPAARTALFLVTCSNSVSDSRGEGLYLDGQSVATQLSVPLAAEPTEVFAEGLPASVIQAKTSQDRQILVGTQNTRYVAWTRLTTPESYGENIKRPDSVYTEKDEFWLGSIYTLALKIPLSERVTLQMGLKEHQYDLRKPALTRQTLPQNIRAKIDGS